MRIVYLPAETQTREMDSNIILALYLVEKYGFDHVMVGDKRLLSVMVRLHLLPPGVFHMKSAQHYLLPFIKKSRAKGFKFTVQNAESIVTFDDDARTDTFMIPPETINYIDKVFCSNSSEYNQLTNIYNCHDCGDDKFVNSGFLRAQGSAEELSRFYKKEISDIKKRCGTFILYNSTAGLMYHGTKSVDSKEMKKMLLGQGIMDEHVDILIEWGVQSQATFFSFLEFTRLFKNKLGEQDINIVFRPHPSENLDFFKLAIGNDERIIIDTSYSVVPWILASELAIGSTSTTLVESAGLGKPTLSFLPDVNLPVMKILRNNIGNKCGKISTSPSELLADVCGVLDGSVSEQYFDGDLAEELLGKKYNAYKVFSSNFKQVSDKIHQNKYLFRLKILILKITCAISNVAIELNSISPYKKKRSAYAKSKFNSNIDIGGYRYREYPCDLDASEISWKKIHGKCILLSKSK